MPPPSQACRDTGDADCANSPTQPSRIARLPHMLERRTKIVATLGPATDAPGVLDRLVAAGMDCARLNCSHGDAGALERRATAVRAAANRCGHPLGLLFDLQGPKLRLSGTTAEQSMRPGAPIPCAGAGEGAGRALVGFAGFTRLVTERS